MFGKHDEQREVILKPDGRVIFPEDVMEDFVMETLGADLWYNDKDKALGVRLLRGVDEPPYPIRRLPGDGKLVRGELEAGAFLNKVGFTPGPAPKTCKCYYSVQYRLIQIALVESGHESERKTTGILDDFPAL